MKHHYKSGNPIHRLIAGIYAKQWTSKVLRSSVISINRGPGGERADWTAFHVGETNTFTHSLVYVRTLSGTRPPLAPGHTYTYKKNCYWKFQNVSSYFLSNLNYLLFVSTSQSLPHH